MSEVFDVRGIISALETHAMSLGKFESVNLHEPKSAPGNGVTCAIWLSDYAASPLSSGMATTSIRAEWSVRIYHAAFTSTPDMIDPTVMEAVHDFCVALAGDFTLGGLVQSVDIMGRHGERVRARPGYQNIDGKIFRVMTILVPVIVDNVWDQVA